MSARIVAERQATHGDFVATSRAAQRLKDVLRDELAVRASRGQPELGDEHLEALDLVLSKIARIVAGDPGHRDHWDDIAGYALLAVGGGEPSQAVST